MEGPGQLPALTDRLTIAILSPIPLQLPPKYRKFQDVTAPRKSALIVPDESQFNCTLIVSGACNLAEPGRIQATNRLFAKFRIESNNSLQLNPLCHWA
jgi:hypothetical protein